MEHGEYRLGRTGPRPKSTHDGHSAIGGTGHERIGTRTGFLQHLGDNDAPPYAVDRTHGIGEHTVLITKVADVRKAQPRTVLGEHASEFINLLAGNALGIINGDHLGHGGFPARFAIAVKHGGSACTINVERRDRVARCERLPRLSEQIRLRDLLGHEHARRTIGVELTELERARFLVQKDVDAGDGNLRAEGIGHAGETFNARIELERGAKALVLYEAKRHLVHDAPHGLSNPRKIA